MDIGVLEDFVSALPIGPVFTKRPQILADLLAPFLRIVYVFSGTLQIGQHAQRVQRPEGVRFETHQRFAVVRGRVGFAELPVIVAGDDGGTAIAHIGGHNGRSRMVRMMKTVSGGMLTAEIHDGKLMLHDEKGGMSVVTIQNVMQSNGVIQVVDSVLLPN